MQVQGGARVRCGIYILQGSMFGAGKRCYSVRITGTLAFRGGLLGFGLRFSHRRLAYVGGVHYLRFRGYNLLAFFHGANVRASQSTREILSSHFFMSLCGCEVLYIRGRGLVFSPLLVRLLGVFLWSKGVLSTSRVSSRYRFLR